ncbi:glycosyltransferase [Priestia megaterium]|uniref:glycosyltransferase n=1 Tax=Priestia megaterium TaxID=1404 RepID=UPI00234E51F7|nr:glycosyltransferase [Priestia megaterium]MDC7771440.1 glycosyltransferase [Priestia megaterium]
MKFSVLLSIYYLESPSNLTQCLESLLQQTLRPNEIVIVKDGKLTIELDKIINYYEKEYGELFKIIDLPENKGLGIALQIGLNHCTYDIVARMDTDDICVKQRFEKQIKYLEENPNVTAIGSWIGEFNKDFQVINNIRKTPVTYNEVRAKSKYRNPLNHMTVMFRKQDIQKVGNYQHFLWNEDYFLWARLLNKGYKISNLPEVLVYVRAGESLFERRGGVKYFKQEVKLQKEFYSMGFINIFQILYNILMRLAVRILPNSMRKNVYEVFLREKYSK